MVVTSLVLGLYFKGSWVVECRYCAYDQIEFVAGAMIAAALGPKLMGWATGPKV
jgi:hypothetical protein